MKNEGDRTDAVVKTLDGLDVVGKLLNDGRFYLTGSKPCIADFTFMSHIDYAVHLTDQTFELYPKLEAFYNRMKNNANMKKYLAGAHHKTTAETYTPSMFKVSLNGGPKIRCPGKLFYFEVDGRAGGIRALLAHAGVRYMDCRQDPKKFGALKQQGFLPLGTMPVWVEDGFKMVQSSAILRMLGVRHGYYSDDPMTAWKIDSLVDFMEDKQGPHAALYLPLFGGATAIDPAHVDPWFANFWDKVIPVLEARLSEHGKKFLAGTDRPTIADFKAF